MTIINHSFRDTLDSRPGNERLCVRYEYYIPSVPISTASALHSLQISPNLIIEGIHIFCNSDDFNIVFKNREVSDYFYTICEYNGIEHKMLEDGINKIAKNTENKPYLYFQLTNNDSVNATGLIRLVLFITQM